MWQRFVRWMRSLFGGAIESLENPELILKQTIRDMRDQMPKINANLANTTSVWYIALYALMIVFFCFFYTEITFNPDETADNMKQYGGFIPGIRAGSATSNYLSYVMNRLNTVGAVYLLFVALIPTVLIMALNLNTKLPFGGTTILIIAGVGLDTLRQAKAQTEQFQYAGFLFEDTDHKEGK